MSGVANALPYLHIPLVVVSVFPPRRRRMDHSLLRRVMPLFGFLDCLNAMANLLRLSAAIDTAAAKSRKAEPNREIFFMFNSSIARSTSW